MCGIAGKLVFDKNYTFARELITKMTRTMSHRGPDGEGYYIKNNIALGHRRLTIIDLNTGQQPLSNEDGTVWVTFNGEIYNYRELRKDLVQRGHRFSTETDTEVLVHLYEEEGESFVTKLRGMFAFAIWDEKKRSLFVARDRVGIKPLYYYHDNDCLIFASEIKAILQDPVVAKEPHLPALIKFLSFYYTPGEETAFKNIKKLLPGHYLTVRDKKVKIKQYWDLNFGNIQNGKHRSLQSYEIELLDLLRDSVRHHMISDVPVGILLSGGVDSTALLNLAVHETDKPISTFTIGFSAHNITDERFYARIAAKKFNTNHYDLTISAKEFIEFLPKYVWHMEEPVCEAAAIALHHVCQLAKNYVKVLISGEGGDEAFAGYTLYNYYLLLEKLKKIIYPIRKTLPDVIPNSNIRIIQRMQYYAKLLRHDFPDYYYSRTATPYNFFNEHFNSLYTPPILESISKELIVGAFDPYLKKNQTTDMINTMLYLDTKAALPDDLLIKADKMSMLNSLELRVPLVDHKVLEFAEALPTNLKINGVKTKFLLKRVLRNQVPEEILNRKKAGFPVPYKAWFRNELRDYVKSILLDPKTLQRGYFNSKIVEDVIEKNQTTDYFKDIFTLLVFEIWHREFIDAN